MTPSILDRWRAYLNAVVEGAPGDSNELTWVVGSTLVGGGTCLAFETNHELSVLSSQYPTPSSGQSGGALEEGDEGWPWTWYWFPRADVRECHCGCQYGGLVLEAPRETVLCLSPSFWYQLAFLDIPWLIDASCRLYMAFSLCLCPNFPLPVWPPVILD